MERLDWSQGEPKDGGAWIQHNLLAKQSLLVLPVVVVGAARALLYLNSKFWLHFGQVGGKRLSIIFEESFQRRILGYGI